MIPKNSKLYIADSDYNRLDVFVAAVCNERSRSNIKKMIEHGQIVVNGEHAKPSSPVKNGDVVVLTDEPPRDIAIVPQNIDIEIVYEDDDIAVINKQQGMVVHPAAGNEDGTLVNAIMFHIKDLSGINGELRPGIVHRLDKNTSGLIVIAKNDFSHVNLAEQIKNKTARRIYRAILYGNIKEDNICVRAPIGRHKSDRKKMAVVSGGREAETNIRVLERFGNYTYVECELKTGRTHQIRVHAKHIGHPVLGDDVYSSGKAPFKTCGQILHAFKLVLVHPRNNIEMVFESSLPGYFEEILQNLRYKK